MSILIQYHRSLWLVALTVRKAVHMIFIILSNALHDLPYHYRLQFLVKYFLPSLAFTVHFSALYSRVHSLSVVRIGHEPFEGSIWRDTSLRWWDCFIRYFAPFRVINLFWQLACCQFNRQLFGRALLWVVYRDLSSASPFSSYLAVVPDRFRSCRSRFHFGRVASVSARVTRLSFCLQWCRIYLTSVMWISFPLQSRGFRFDFSRVASVSSLVFLLSACRLL